MPQWQGGNNPDYSFGARLLAWLAPSAENSPLVEVPVEPYDGSPARMENNTIAQSVLLRQLRSATQIIEAHQPERIVMFGGDCLVSQAPFDYLNNKCGGKLGLLWLDAHPDVSTPDIYPHAHAMVLGNLMGEGSPAFSAMVKCPFTPEFVMYGGLQEVTAREAAIVKRLGIRKAGVRELAESSDPVIAWIKENQIRHLAIHLDLDVLDPVLFRSLLFSKPGGEAIDAPHGEMTLPQISRLIHDISSHTEITGLAIAEHLPWDAINLHSFLKSLPIFE